MSRTTWFPALVFTAAAFATAAPAAIHRVEPGGTGDYPTIQSAIDAAASGDTVTLATGTFTGPGNKNLDTAGKAIVITSVEGPDSAVIDCEGDGRGFHIHSGEGPGTVIERIQVRNGNAELYTRRGGALLLEGTSPTVRDNIFFYNFADSGGAVYVIDSNSDFIRNDFQYNDCVYMCDPEPVPAPPPPDGPARGPAEWQWPCGGAVLARNSDLRFIGNRFYKNMTLNMMMAPGIFAAQSHLVVIGNQLTGNGWLYSDGGGLTLDGCTATVLGNRFGNSAWIGAGIYARATSAEVRGNDFSHGFGYVDAGGVRAEDGSSFDISYNFFNDHHGGAVSLRGSQGDIRRNILARARNADMFIGVGIQLFNASPTISQNTFYHNASDYQDGADVYLRNANPTIERNVFVSSAGGDPIGCYSIAASPSTSVPADVSYQILWNVPLPDGWSYPLYWYTCGSMYGVIADPMLCDPGHNNFFPAEGSPCQTDTIPGIGYSGGALFGALPVGCDLSEMLSIYVPPAAAVVSPVAGELYVLGDVWLTNTSNVPATINYRVEIESPYRIDDNGDPLSLVGTTPVLAPGAGWTPPNAAIVTPEAGTPVSVDVHYYASYAPAVAMEVTATTTVRFGGPVAVGLASFAGVESAGAVDLEWETSEALNPDGWRVYRSEAGYSELLTVTPLAGETRRYHDDGVEPDRRYTYILVSLEADGEHEAGWTRVETAPAALSLEQNVPNPFNPVTTIRFSLHRAGRASLSIYSIDGSRVATIIDRPLRAGPHEVTWDGTDGRGRQVASGVYLYRLRTGSKSLVRKMVLLK